MKNRKGRRKRRSRFRGLIIGTGLIISPFLIIFLWGGVENFTRIFHSEEQVINLLTPELPFYVGEGNRSNFESPHFGEKQKNEYSRPQIYPYSVVKGGVHSIQELRSAIWRDPIVARHYSNFKLDRARIIKAKAAENFHVSYRIGQEIFWTKKKLRVAKGERFITDGRNIVRTRCANMLSEVPQGRTSPDEPTPEVFDKPLNPFFDPAPIIPAALNGGKIPPAGLSPPAPPPTVLPAAFVGELPGTWMDPSGSPALRPPVSTVEDLWPPALFLPGPLYFPSPIVTGGRPGTTSIPFDPPPFIPPVAIGGAPRSPGDGNGDWNSDGLPNPLDPAPFIPPVIVGGGPWSAGDGSGGWDSGGPTEGKFAVPEPSTVMLLGPGLLGLVGVRRKFRK